MTPSEAPVPDRPFPGAHSQVPGAHGQATLSSEGPPAAPRVLPLGSRPERVGQGWSVRLPVRAEEVTVAKEVMVRERVVLRREQVEEVQQGDSTIRREELQVRLEGAMESGNASKDASERTG